MSLVDAQIDASRPGLLRRGWLWCELAFLYVLVPPIVAGLLQPQLGDPLLRRVGIMNLSFDTGLPRALLVFSLLMLTFAAMFGVLWFDPSFDRKRLWGWDRFKSDLRRILLVFCLMGPVAMGASWAMAYFTDLMPEGGFLRLPREMPVLMVMIALLYPWFSAYPQEVTHRAFFFHRYRSIIGTGTLAFVLNVAAFSWLHITMWNWIALVMTVPAGILFAYTYRRSESALAAGFEHAIYGVWVFFTGLGFFVYTGNVDGG